MISLSLVLSLSSTVQVCDHFALWDSVHTLSMIKRASMFFFKKKILASLVMHVRFFKRILKYNFLTMRCALGLSSFQIWTNNVIWIYHRVCLRSLWMLRQTISPSLFNGSSLRLFALWDSVPTTLSMLKRASMLLKKKVSHHWWCMCDSSNEYWSIIFSQCIAHWVRLPFKFERTMSLSIPPSLLAKSLDVKTDDLSLSLSLSLFNSSCLRSFRIIGLCANYTKHAQESLNVQKNKISHHWWCMCDCSNEYRSMVSFTMLCTCGLSSFLIWTNNVIEYSVA